MEYDLYVEEEENKRAEAGSMFDDNKEFHGLSAREAFIEGFISGYVHMKRFTDEIDRTMEQNDF